MSKNRAINLLRNSDLTEKNRNIINHKNLLSHLKMDNEIIKSGDTEIKKHKFHCYKSPIF